MGRVTLEEALQLGPRMPVDTILVEVDTRKFVPLGRVVS